MSSNKIVVSIVTVVYNALSTIEKTMQSVINQSYPYIEYIIIDGASTDGTVEIIRKYIDKISIFVSEADKGIYDAMNKGILLTKGNLVNFMNAGDVYCDNQVVENIVNGWEENYCPDIIYGNSWIEQLSGTKIRITAGFNQTDLNKGPIFRHGAMFVSGTLQKQHLFKTDKKYAVCADFDFIYHMHTLGKRMVFYNRDVLKYSEGGVSSNEVKCVKLNKMVVMKYTPKFKYRVYFSVLFITTWLRVNLKKNKTAFSIGLFLTRFIWHYLPNYIIAFVPFYFIRHLYYRFVCRIKIATGASVHMKTYIRGRQIQIGKNSVINHSCMLDGRDVISIGENVSISPYVHIITASHEVNSPNFDYFSKPVIIEDYAWIGSRATILPGVTVAEGAVVGVGAVVVKNVEPYTVVAGVPAKKIGNRPKGLHYNTRWDPFFD